MIKPDAVSGGHTDKILAQLRDSGFLVVARKTETLTQERAKAFYAEHASKPFYADLVKFMTSGPVEALVLERMNAITAWRLLQVCVCARVCVARGGCARASDGRGGGRARRTPPSRALTTQRPRAAGLRRTARATRRMGPTRLRPQTARSPSGARSARPRAEGEGEDGC